MNPELALKSIRSVLGSRLIMKQPVEPKAEDCCNSGCNPCIFDVYQKQLLLYKRYVEGEYVDVPVQNAISQLDYSTFLLVKSISICKAHRLLIFRHTTQDNCRLHWNPGDHFLLKYSNDGLSCSRAYTPLKPLLCCHDDEIKANDFAIIVKKYNSGIISDYLYNLDPGKTTLWRGPYGSYEIKANAFKRIIMIAQGTGVLPFISIIDKILDDEDNMTKLILYYCCENDGSILLRDKLFAYKCYWNFTYKIFLGCLLPNAVLKYSEPLINHRLTLEEFSELLPLTAEDQFLLSGSPQFMEEYQQGILTLSPAVHSIKLF